MQISIGCDHGGLLHKQLIAGILNEMGHAVVDHGTYTIDSCDYPDYAYPVAVDVASGKSQLGVVVCTTGIGVSIVANKVDGVRCALCHNVEGATLTRQHNNSNVLAIGARFVETDNLKAIVEAFVNTQFEGGRHEKRVDKITAVQNGTYTR